MATELTEWRPFSDFAELRHRLDQAFRDLSEGAQHGWIPSVDLVKKEGALVLRADIPGIKPDDVKIEVEGGVLTVSGEHREEEKEEKEHYMRRASAATAPSPVRWSCRGEFRPTTSRPNARTESSR